MRVDVARMRAVARSEDVLGEIPLWDERLKRLTWVDLLRAKFHAYDPATDRSLSLDLPEKVGSYCLADGERLVVAGRSGLFWWSPQDGGVESIANPEADRPNNIMNDGRVDPAGRFLFGSMDRMIAGGSGRLWSFEAGSPPRALISEGIFVPNGLCWSPCGRTLYFGDSELDCIFAYDYDVATGSVGRRRLFADTRVLGGRLDGCSVDCDGYIWHVRFGTGLIVRFNPAGGIDAAWQAPTSQPTHLTFGGAELSTLYVTSGRFRMPQQQTTTETAAGALFAMEVNVSGLPENRFASGGSA
jgi:L-arabinonolactonase